MRPQEQVALSVATDYFLENKKPLKNILNEKIIDIYKDTLENGLLNSETDKFITFTFLMKIFSF